MVSRPEECVFYENGFCIFTDMQCGKVCNLAMRELTKMAQPGFRAHLELYWYRRERTVDLVTRWIAVGVSLVALILSILEYVGGRSDKNNILYVKEDKRVGEHAKSDQENASFPYIPQDPKTQQDLPVKPASP